MTVDSSVGTVVFEGLPFVRTDPLSDQYLAVLAECRSEFSDDIALIGRLIKTSGFTHYNMEKSLWVALPPDDVNSTDVVCLSTATELDSPFYVGLTVNVLPDTDTTTVVGVDHIESCVAAVFTPSMSEKAELIGDGNVLAFFVRYTQVSDNFYRTLLEGTHHTFDVYANLDYKRRLITKVAQLCPVHILNEFLAAHTEEHWAQIHNTERRMPMEEGRRYTWSVERYMDIICVTADRDVTGVDWDKVWDIAINEQLEQREALVVAARHSLAAELGCTVRRTLDDPIPFRTASALFERLRAEHGGFYALELLQTILGKRTVHPSTLEFFAFGDIPELRAVVAKHPSLPLRFRTAVTVSLNDT